MIKLVALDLDHTLLQKDLTIPEDVLDTLRKAIDKGTKITICTGRMYETAKKYAEMISKECMVIAYNGARVHDGYKYIFKSDLSPDTIKQIAKYCKDNNLYIQFYEKDSILCEKETDDTRWDPDLKLNKCKEIGDFSKYNFIPSPKGLLISTEDKVKGYMKDIYSLLGDKIYLSQSLSFLIEIMEPNVNKRASLAKLAARLGIKQEEVMACGDNFNDIEMIKYAGIGVAMNNAIPELKKEANYVTKNDRSYGVKEAIEKFCLR